MLRPAFDELARFASTSNVRFLPRWLFSDDYTNDRFPPKLTVGTGPLLPFTPIEIGVLEFRKAVIHRLL